jgi:hypothetical protein
LVLRASVQAWPLLSSSDLSSLDTWRATRAYRMRDLLLAYQQRLSPCGCVMLVQQLCALVQQPCA